MGARENMKQAVRELIGMVAAEEKEEPEATPQEDECAQAVIHAVNKIALLRSGTICAVLLRPVTYC